MTVLAGLILTSVTDDYFELILLYVTHFRERTLAIYFVESLNTHNLWALKMLFVEFLNLINCIGNIYFVDVFLGGEFSTYGMDVLRFLEADPENRVSWWLYSITSV